MLCDWFMFHLVLSAFPSPLGYTVIVYSHNCHCSFVVTPLFSFFFWGSVTPHTFVFYLYLIVYFAFVLHICAVKQSSPTGNIYVFAILFFPMAGTGVILIECDL